MIKHGLKRFGLWPVVAALTAVAVVASVAITVAIHIFILRQTPDTPAIAISITVPAVIGPVMSALVLRLVSELDAAHDRLRILSYSDALTGAYNRRYFMEQLKQEVERYNRYGSPFAIAVFDADDFKAINDRHGHPAGDEVLRRMATLCQMLLRQTDVFARLGGEEFGLLLPQTRTGDAAHLLERLRERVAQLEVEIPGHSVGLTISIGLYGPQGGETDADAVLRQVDEALYAAKRQGKNRVVCEPLQMSPRAA